MNRHLVYPGQIPLETDLLNVAKDAYVGQAKLAEAMVGSTPVLAGFAVTPTSPASLTVQIAPGQIYLPQELDPSDYSSLGEDTSTVIKQGLALTAQTPALGTFAAPGTAGQSINYLIQVGYQSSDTGPTVLPYYNSSSPTLAWSGPDNSGSSQATVRADQAMVTVLAGAAATTGSQITPTPGAGCVGAYVVTVANGQASITSGNISVYSNTSFIGNQPAGFSLNALAPLASPAFTGNPTAPTQAPGDNSGKLASTAFVAAGLATVGAITGEVKLWTVNSAPSGYLECDGSAISRSTYATLFSVIGVAFGVGDGTTTFNLPDMRGMFARGWDHGAGVDSGRAFGSTQQDALQEFSGTFNASTESAAVTGACSETIGGTSVSYSVGGNNLSNVTVTIDPGLEARTATETRPKNIALMYIIKT